MNDATRKPRRRSWLDGRHTWGTLEVAPTRYGVARYRLVVFPPGMSADERRLLRAWRTWPIWGTATFLVLEIVLIPAFSSSAALGISTGVALGAGGVIMAMTGANRCAVRTLSAVRMACVEDTVAAERLAALDSMAQELASADRRLADGDIDTVEHEFLMWRVYDRMAVDAHTSA